MVNHNKLCWLLGDLHATESDADNLVVSGIVAWLQIPHQLLK